MAKIVSLEDRRNTLHYKDGDAIRAVVWAKDTEGARELETAIHDVLFTNDEESAERLRRLLGECVAVYKKHGPGT